MPITFLLLILLGIILFLALFTYFVPIGLWITAFFAGVRVKRDLIDSNCRPIGFCEFSDFNHISEIVGIQRESSPLNVP